MSVLDRNDIGALVSTLADTQGKSSPKILPHNCIQNSGVELFADSRSDN